MSSPTQKVFAKSARHPMYFRSGEQELFGWLHPGSGEQPQTVGLLICKPFGYESICSHRSLQAFADTASAIGFPAMEFDYLGTGDSAEIDPEANQLDIWTRNVVSAIETLRHRTGVHRVCILGIRLGALLATLAAAQSESVAGLILISPIVNGRRYLREMRTTRLAAASVGAAGPQSSTESSGRDLTAKSSPMEVSGFWLSAASIAAMAQVDMTILRPPVSDILILDGITMPIARGWSDALAAAGHQVRYAALPGLVELIMTMPHDARPPVAMLATMRDWLLQLPTATLSGGPAAGTAPDAQEANQPVAALEIGGGESQHSAVITEHPVFIDSAGIVFGILATPPSGQVCRRAVIFLNAGATYHVGPNRVYVSLARQWARAGYLVLRMDLAGLGDSCAQTNRPDNEVFPPAALSDVGAAINFMRARHDLEELTLCGFCSGAYHALRAAVAALPVDRILLVNPERFFWKEGSDLHALELAEVVRRPRDHRERIFSIAAWKRLVTGKVDIWRLVMIYLHRPALAVESVLRDTARWLGIRLPRDLGSELEELAARHVRMVFVFASGEAGIDLLRLQAGSSIKRVAKQCNIHCIDGADHIFSENRTRGLLEQILTRELFATHTRTLLGGEPQVPAYQRPPVIGVVIIGRNEGDRLRRCLESVRVKDVPVVYVDSGSTDGSVAMSRAAGITVVELDMSTPFTAARARNAGFRRLLEGRPDLEQVFFVDGDCEVVDGWLEGASRFMQQRPTIAVVCGRRSEKYPQHSLYNMLIDLEWKVPSGETTFCGGDALMRVEAFQQAGGYRPDMICGEEPELCFRMREKGWKIWCLGDPMTVHDAAIYHFGQWWKRALRTGYGFAMGANLHGSSPERVGIRESRRIWIWGFFVPLVVLILTSALGWWALLLLLIYPLRVLRLFVMGRYSARQNWWRAVSLVVCQFPEFLGQLKFAFSHVRGVQSPLIEYK